jgi:hypothetical protein
LAVHVNPLPILRMRSTDVVGAISGAALGAPVGSAPSTSSNVDIAPARTATLSSTSNLTLARVSLSEASPALTSAVSNVPSSNHVSKSVVTDSESSSEALA